MASFKVMCVQPIKIKDNLYSEIIMRLHDNNVTLLNFINKKKFSTDWLTQFTKSYSKFKHLSSIAVKDSELAELLINDLNNKCFFVNEMNLSDFLIPKNSKFDILFDSRLFCFVIIYEICFDIPNDCLTSLLKYSNNNESPKDLYNTIRNLMVKESDGREIGGWANKIRDMSIEEINEICKKIVGVSKLKELTEVSPKEKLIYCRHNTGNITFFIDEEPCNFLLKDEFIRCNKGAEKIRRSPVTVLDENMVSYSFFGRFHTIITKDQGRHMRYASIQFHIQYIWFVTGGFIEALDNLNNSPLSESGLHLVDEYINKIELLLMFNESFKLTIEADKSLIYEKIEKIWNIENSLINVKKYISFYNNYLVRNYNRKLEKSNNRRNSILFLLSCIQVISLLSVWKDYIDLNSKNYVDWLTLFNSWLPFILSLFICVILILVKIKK